MRIQENPNWNTDIIEIGDIVFYNNLAEKKARYCRVAKIEKDIIGISQSDLIWGNWVNSIEEVHKKDVKPFSHTLRKYVFRYQITNWRERLK